MTRLPHADNFPFGLMFAGGQSRERKPLSRFRRILFIALSCFIAMKLMERAEWERTSSDVLIAQAHSIERIRNLSQLSWNDRVFLRENVRIATAVSPGSGYYEALQNLIGSLHLFEPTVTLTIYALNFTDDVKRRKLDSWRNVEVIDFRPQGHVLRFANFAFKPLIIADMLSRHHAVMWLDAGMIVQRPIDGMLLSVLRDGHFFVNVGLVGNSLSKTSQRLLGFGGVSVKKWPNILGGEMGFRAGSLAHERVLLPVVECAKRKECMDPPDASAHGFDQAMVSLYVHKFNFSFFAGPVYGGWVSRKFAPKWSDLHPFEVSPERVALATRRSPPRRYNACAMTVADAAVSPCRRKLADNTTFFAHVILPEDDEMVLEAKRLQANGVDWIDGEL